MKISIDNMELPQWDVVKATPIEVDLKHGRIMTFEIPNVKKYFNFEAYYVYIISKHLELFSNVMFLTADEFSDNTLKSRMLNQINIAMQNRKFRKLFIKLLNKYFTANFKIKKLDEYMNPLNFADIFLLVHGIIESVKKKFKKVSVQLQTTTDQAKFSTSSKGSSTKIEPRF